MNLTGLNVDPSDEGSNKSNTDTESIRNKLRKRVEELQKERKDKMRLMMLKLPIILTYLTYKLKKMMINTILS